MGGKRGATRGRPFRPFRKVPYLVSEIYILFPFCRFSTGRPPGKRGGIWCRLGLANFRGMLRRLEKLASNKSSDAGSLSQAAEVPDHGKSDLVGCFEKLYVHMGGTEVLFVAIRKGITCMFQSILRGQNMHKHFTCTGLLGIFAFLHALHMHIVHIRS